MTNIYYIDRTNGQRCEEEVYGGSFLRFLYGKNVVSKILGQPMAFLLARLPFLSAFYGDLQNLPRSAKKIEPFIKAYGIDTSEFVKKPSEFTSFNDFFTRKLKPSVRPIAEGTDTAIIPADGRFLFYQRIDQADGFVVKGEKFTLEKLLADQKLADEYSQGSMVIARLCPTDYHRYHFPCDCTPEESRLINGWLYSVNPMAIKKNVEIFTENKRMLCILKTERFGKVLFLEIGATFVGAIHQTYHPFQHYSKGEEKGFFSFGASSLIVLFPPNAIKFDQDLLDLSADHLEIRCLMGRSMGKAIGYNLIA